MFWGNSPHTSVIFEMQKRVIKITMGYGYRESCRELFNELKILTFSSQYTFSLLRFIVYYRDYFVSNIVYHNINMRQKKLFTLASVISVHVSVGSLLFRHQLFNGLPKAIMDISGRPKKFKIALKHYLLTCSFYSLDDFFF